MISVNPSLTFEIWAIEFIGPFLIPAKRKGARYIITAVEYVTKWAEAEPVDTYSSEIAAKFIYDNIITRFGCPLTLISDQGTVDVIVTSECIHLYFLSIVTRCLFRDVL